MSVNALPVEIATAEIQVNTIAELMAWLKHSGYADKTPQHPQSFAPRIVSREETPAGWLRHSPIKGL